MGSRDDGQKTYHSPLLSSLVVRPSHSDSGGGGVTVGRRDCESGEVRHDPPPSYSRSSRYSDDHGLDDVEEELLTVDLCLLLNRLDIGRFGPPRIVCLFVRSIAPHCPSLVS